MRLINLFIWMVTGYPLHFAGISAGTAAGIAVAAGGAIASGVGSSNAAGAGRQAAAQSAFWQQLAARATYQDQMRANQQVNDIMRPVSLQTQGINEKALQQGTNINRSTQYNLSNRNLTTQNRQYAGQQKAQTQTLGLQKNNINNNYGYQVGAAQAGQQYGIQGVNAMQNASNQAYNAQMGALGGMDTQYQNAYNDIQGQYQPYTSAGTSALQNQQDLMGLNGQEAYDKAMQPIQGGQYGALAKQGENALLQNAGATGGVRGGNTAAALAQFRPQMLQGLIDKQFSNLTGVRDLGAGMTQQLSGYRNDLGQNLAATQGQRGQYGATNAMNQGGYGQDIANIQGQYAQRIGDLKSGRSQDYTNAMTNDTQVRLQNYMNNSSGVRDIENEKALKLAGIDLNQLKGATDLQTGGLRERAGLDANKIMQDFNANQNLYNSYAGLQTQQAQTMGNINANQSLAMGNMAGSLIGAAGSGLQAYYSQPRFQPQQQQQQYGFQGLRSQGNGYSPYNQGNPQQNFWG